VTCRLVNSIDEIPCKLFQVRYIKSYSQCMTNHP